MEPTHSHPVFHFSHTLACLKFPVYFGRPVRLLFCVFFFFPFNARTCAFQRVELKLCGAPGAPATRTRPAALCSESCVSHRRNTGPHRVTTSLVCRCLFLLSIKATTTERELPLLLPTGAVKSAAQIDLGEECRSLGLSMKRCFRGIPSSVRILVRLFPAHSLRVQQFFIDIIFFFLCVCLFHQYGSIVYT